MKQQSILTNGQPVPIGQRVMVDHSLTTLTLTIRSQGPVSADTVKALLQQRHEVTGIQTDQRIDVCRPC